MSANSATNLKSRLRVVPIDEWSTREKLCLASSVLKSGDQNWSSVSRPLKSFAEPNRPHDWFHQKYCAIQYHDLLEKIETETPKRKRSERGEETPQTIIVRNLTKQRIEELKQITQKEREMISKYKRDLDSLKNNKMSDKRFHEILDEIKDKEIKEKEREIEHKKWLEEREVKIAQMSRKGTLHPRKSVSTPTTTTPVTPILQPIPQTVSTPSAEGNAKSPLNEPLKVEVDSEMSSGQTTAQNPTNESKLSLALTSPSTSPLLTSLLQSPTPSTPNILSPNKSGLSANSLNRQKPLTPVSAPMSQITRRPSIHSSPLKTIEDKTNDNKESIASHSGTPTVSGNPSQIPQKTSVESSKLSKLLETSNTSRDKTNVIEIDSIQTKSNDNKETEQKNDNKTNRQNSGLTSSDEIQIIDSQSKTNVLSKKSDESHRNEEISERLVRNSDKTNKSKTDSESVESVDDKKESEKSEDLNEIISIKQEVIEINVEDDKRHKEMDKTSIKEEPMDSNSTTTEEDSNQRTPSNRLTKRTRKTPNPITPTITPTAMRRSSRRVAQKDSKSANDESTEVSDQSAANTPQTIKKRGSVDDTTETSMSEESMDARSVAPPASIETVPNSPASVRTDDMDNSKEYRTWKKAIMVNWRLISAHKNASLFTHPVTEADAKGYEDIVHNPIDLNSIKKRVETGVIRTTAEYQRDILLMFQNAIMFNNADHDVHKMAVDMQKDTIDSIEDFIETRKQDNQSNESKLRARDRRSNVSTPLASNDNEISGRRKSRGASTDTDSNASGLTKSLTKKKKN